MTNAADVIILWTGESLVGMKRQHLFNDAIVLSLFGIWMFLDALRHSRSV